MLKKNLQPGHYKDGLRNKEPLNPANLSIWENQRGFPERDEKNRSQYIKTQGTQDKI